MRKIAVISVARSDYGIYKSIIRRIQASAEFELIFIAAGAHLSPAFGMTVEEIVRDGVPIAERIQTIADTDAPEGISSSMAVATLAFGRAYSRLKPDILMVLGDRFEMHSAALAALPFVIPVAHIHGGELTLGAFDDALRHSITKLSHLHFVSTSEYARRIAQLGEEPWRITISGAPALDNISATTMPDASALEAKYSVPFGPKPLLVTYHPVTLEYHNTEVQIGQLLHALGKINKPILFTMPNADTYGSRIRSAIRNFVERNPAAHVIESLGSEDYFSVMATCAAMVGNSSSGVIEAASFLLPVVNIGTRQNGRLRAKNVIDVGNTSSEICEGIQKALSSEFRASLCGLKNPYAIGNAAEIIVSKLEKTPIDARLTIKHFVDIKL